MSKISADNISDKNDTVSVPTTTVVAGSAKAWVNFNGTGTVAIRDSFNVSSITDNGTGDYTVNYTTAMPNANYGFSLMSNGFGTRMKAATATNVGNISMETINSGGTNQDYDYCSATTFANP